MSKMNLGEWLQRLESLHPKEIEMGLGRIAQVARRLPVTNIATKVITVAGTNGKGTTSGLIENILSAAGLRVGVYSSPHMLAYNERIKICGHYADDEQICDAFVRVDRARGEIPLTYFEFGTLAAFDLFARADLDIAILEVGLGGRLDATNIIDPDIAVITSIALDHQSWLGDTREAIGFEKAGIMRAASPIVCGDPEPPLSLIHHAESLAAELDCLGQQYGYEISTADSVPPVEWEWWGSDANGERKFADMPMPKIPLENAATAIQVVMRLQLPISDEHVQSGLKKTSLLGRYQRLQHSFPIILDVAHNPHAAAYLCSRLQQESVTGQIYGLIGIMADKDYEKVVETLLPVVDHWLCCDLDTSRALDSETLLSEVRKQGATGDKFASVETAISGIDERLSKDDLLVVFGSFDTVGDALNYYGEKGIVNG